jgi:hypothetical protein
VQEVARIIDHDHARRRGQQAFGTADQVHADAAITRSVQVQRRSLADWISRERASHFGAGPNDAQDLRLAESLTAWWERRRTEAS